MTDINKLQLYKIGMVVKFDRKYDRFEIYNKMRAIQDVVIVTPKDVQALDRKQTASVEFGYVTIKFISTTTPIDSVQKIEIAAIRGHETAKKIDGLIAVYYDPKKIEKV